MSSESKRPPALRESGTAASADDRAREPSERADEVEAWLLTGEDRMWDGEDAAEDPCRGDRRGLRSLAPLEDWMCLDIEMSIEVNHIHHFEYSNCYDKNEDDSDNIIIAL